MNVNFSTFPYLLKESKLVFVSNNSSGEREIHTFSIVETNNEEYKFRGYAGFDKRNKVELFLSKDLKEWVYYPDNPIMERPGLRWPSVILDSGIFYMAARGHLSRFQKETGRLGIFLNKNMNFWHKVKASVAGSIATYINLYKSEDGVKFDFVKTLVSKGENGNPYNQNPFLFRDPVSKKIFLFYYSGNGYSNFEIHVRYADNIEELDRGKDEVIIRSDRVLAAPGVFYDETTEIYWILAETTIRDKWAIKAFYSKNITSNYQEIRNPILIDDVACPFPFVSEKTLYLFVSKRIGSHKWKEKLYLADLSAKEGLKK